MRPEEREALLRLVEGLRAGTLTSDQAIEQLVQLSQSANDSAAADGGALRATQSTPDAPVAAGTTNPPPRSCASTGFLPVPTGVANNAAANNDPGAACAAGGTIPGYYQPIPSPAQYANGYLSPGQPLRYAPRAPMACGTAGPSSDPLDWYNVNDRLNRLMAVRGNQRVTPTQRPLPQWSPSSSPSCGSGSGRSRSQPPFRRYETERSPTPDYSMTINDWEATRAGGLGGTPCSARSSPAVVPGSARLNATFNVPGRQGLNATYNVPNLNGTYNISGRQNPNATFDVPVRRNLNATFDVPVRQNLNATFDVPGCQNANTTFNIPGRQNPNATLDIQNPNATFDIYGRPNPDATFTFPGAARNPNRDATYGIYQTPVPGGRRPHAPSFMPPTPQWDRSYSPPLGTTSSLSDDRSFFLQSGEASWDISEDLSSILGGAGQVFFPSPHLRRYEQSVPLQSTRIREMPDFRINYSWRGSPDIPSSDPSSRFSVLSGSQQVNPSGRGQGRGPPCVPPPDFSYNPPPSPPAAIPNVAPVCSNSGNGNVTFDLSGTGGGNAAAAPVQTCAPPPAAVPTPPSPSTSTDTYISRAQTLPPFSDISSISSASDPVSIYNATPGRICDLDNPFQSTFKSTPPDSGYSIEEEPRPNFVRYNLPWDRRVIRQMNFTNCVGLDAYGNPAPAGDESSMEQDRVCIDSRSLTPGSVPSYTSRRTPPPSQTTGFSLAAVQRRLEFSGSPLCPPNNNATYTVPPRPDATFTVPAGQRLNPRVPVGQNPNETYVVPGIDSRSGPPPCFNATNSIPNGAFDFNMSGRSGPGPAPRPMFDLSGPQNSMPNASFDCSGRSGPGPAPRPMFDLSGPQNSMPNASLDCSGRSGPAPAPRPMFDLSGPQNSMPNASLDCSGRSNPAPAGPGPMLDLSGGPQGSASFDCSGRPSPSPNPNTSLDLSGRPSPGSAPNNRAAPSNRPPPPPPGFISVYQPGDCTFEIPSEFSTIMSDGSWRYDPTPNGSFDPNMPIPLQSTRIREAANWPPAVDTPSTPPCSRYSVESGSTRLTGRVIRPGARPFVQQPNFSSCASPQTPTTPTPVAYNSVCQSGEGTFEIPSEFSTVMSPASWMYDPTPNGSYDPNVPIPLQSTRIREAANWPPAVDTPSTPPCSRYSVESGSTRLTGRVIRPGARPFVQQPNFSSCASPQTPTPPPVAYNSVCQSGEGTFEIPSEFSTVMSPASWMYDPTPNGSYDPNVPIPLQSTRIREAANWSQLADTPSTQPSLRYSVEQGSTQVSGRVRLDGQGMRQPDFSSCNSTP